MKGQIITEKNNGTLHFIDNNINNEEIKMIKEKEELSDRLLFPIIDNLDMDGLSFKDVKEIYVIFDNEQDKKYYCDKTIVSQREGL